MSRFIYLTLTNIPWFVGIFVLLIAVGYLLGDLNLSSIYWPGFIAGLALSVLAVSAVSAAQAVFRERRAARKSSN